MCQRELILLPEHDEPAQVCLGFVCWSHIALTPLFLRQITIDCGLAWGTPLVRIIDDVAALMRDVVVLKEADLSAAAAAAAAGPGWRYFVRRRPFAGYRDFR